MKRRHLLLTLLAGAAVPPALAADPPWQARLLKGGFDGKVWWSGFQIILQPDWKTYWRVPGEGGIAPQLDITGENIASHEEFYPMPSRFEDDAGMTNGYKNEVVLPLAIAPADMARPVKLSIKAFFGVCDVVCIPAQFEASTAFDAAVSDAPDQPLISRWRRRVPKVSTEGPVIRAKTKFEDGKTMLWLDLKQAVRDIFVEGSASHYFGKQGSFRGFAMLPVSGVKSPDELKGSTLRITMEAFSGPVEQWVTVE